jgi:hypothetical protein
LTIIKLLIKRLRFCQRKVSTTTCSCDNFCLWNFMQFSTRFFKSSLSKMLHKMSPSLYMSSKIQSYAGVCVTGLLFWHQWLSACSDPVVFLRWFELNLCALSLQLFDRLKVFQILNTLSIRRRRLLTFVITTGAETYFNYIYRKPILSRGVKNLRLRCVFTITFLQQT